MLVVHPDTKCFKEVTFQVVSHEGNVFVSCATSVKFGFLYIILLHICEYYLSIMDTYYGYWNWVLKYSSTKFKLRY